MKKILLILLLAVGFLSTATAYAFHGEPRKSPVDFLIEELELNDDQANTIASLFEEARDACEESSSREERHECMKAQKETLDSEIATLLTEDQLEVFNELQSRRREHKRERCAND